MFSVIYQTSVSVTIELRNDACFYSGHNYEIRVDDEPRLTTDRNVCTVYGLEPNRAYNIAIWENGRRLAEQFVKTDEEAYLLDVRDFGAKGDGVAMDTPAIQAAILCAPPNSRVYVPAGDYLCTPLFLKSDVTLHLERGARLVGVTDRAQYPILPGVIKDYDEEREAYLGSWEGNPLDSFASLITAVGVENARVIGEGILDGNAGRDNWWRNHKTRNIAWRPRMVYFFQCKNMALEGVTIQNSPAWTIHPHQSQGLKFLNLTILNPSDSPNTDGMDPEYCRDVLICGVRFSVGDDCLVLKSGKIFMGKKNLPPTGNFRIRNNLMERGHGAVVIGSEIAGGVRDIFIEQCLFRETDRGLRVKTRRGRGRNSVVDNICLRNVRMDKVLTPFVFNMFYHCDPDGKSEYVYTKDTLPLDDRTPTIGRVTIQNVICENAEVAALYAYGLPENKIASIEMEDVSVTMADNAQPGEAAMMSFIEPMCRAGVYVNNVRKVSLKNVTLRNIDGEEITAENTDSLTRE